MEVELEPDVTSWYLELDHNEQDVAAAHVDLLSEYGHLLRMPHSRPLVTAYSNSGSTWAAWHGGSPIGIGPTE